MQHDHTQVMLIIILIMTFSTHGLMLYIGVKKKIPSLIIGSVFLILFTAYATAGWLGVFD